ncbi:uncharacterized protein At4g00950-like [Prosopis cineraria]|uniref:uncharacterized protein At4g00950-like n=1 Tax=Prosopis cineraria TaxID=364024 RepID=UPI0024103478|nr:uncharacterized protein At4g00950-like [Prosopis cineraria]
MNSDAEEHNTVPKLPLLLSVPSMPSPEHSGAATPPLHTLASVPFRWEEEPGKPRPCTALVPFDNNPTCDLPSKSLDLPPRLLFEAKLTKLLSPTSVLEGSSGSSDSFRSPPSFRAAGSFSDEKGRLGALVLNRGGLRDKGGGWFGSWRKKGLRVRREVSWGSYVFPSSADNRDCDDDAGVICGGTNKMKRSGSFPSAFQANSCVWTTISQNLKQVVPWRIKKQRKGGSGYELKL